MHKIQAKRFYYMMFAWFLINLVQAMFTPVLGDEAYYMIYSLDLNWGYFDHPPAIALLTWISSGLFDDELGIRFMTLVLNAATMLLCWNLIPAEKKQHKHAALTFFIILLCIPIFHVYSFVTTPDVPLLFSFALYLLWYKDFLMKQNLLNALLLGLGASMLIYSKYQGGVLILISILIKPQLLKSGWLYISGFFALILITPHLNWLYENDFVTLQYHLIDRQQGTVWENMSNYFAGVSGVLNLLILIPLFYFMWLERKKIQQQTKWMQLFFFGILAFFLLYTLRSRVEAHWMASALIPMSWLVYNMYFHSNGFARIFRPLALTTLGLMIAIRVLITLPLDWDIEFYEEKAGFYSAIEEIADGKQVVYLNSYRNASKHLFYEGKKAFTYNSVFYRKTQFDLNDFGESFHNNRVLLANHHSLPDPITTTDGMGGEIHCQFVDSFQVFTKLKGHLEDSELKLKVKKKHTLTIRILNPYSYNIELNKGDLPLSFYLYLANKEREISIPLECKLEVLPAGKEIVVPLECMPAEIESGSYEIAICIKPGFLDPQRISQNYKAQFVD